MKLSVSINVRTDAATLLEYLYSEEYLQGAVAECEAVSRAEVEERSEDGTTFAVRWYAPTKLPRVLKRYEGKAPQSVNWLERTTWNRDTFEATLTVIPDVPESWHSKYRSSGKIQLIPKGSSVELRQELEFSMDFGMVGMALEKLLKNEVEALLSQRLEVLKTHF